MSTCQQTWPFKVASKTPVNTMAVREPNPVMKIMRWLHYLGGRREDYGYLKSGLNLPPNFRIGGGIGL